ncbi:MAG: peptidase inhibitor family I36 protein [Natronosporangium sp.]
MAATLGAALLIDVSAANAGPSQAEASSDSTVRDSAGRHVEVHYAQPTTDAPGTAPTRSPTASPYVVVGHSASGGASPADDAACLAFEVCLWTGLNFTGNFVGFGGNYAPCQGWRFEGTVFQDDVASIWNRASGPISIWNRFSDGSFNYHKFGWLRSGYRHGVTQFSFIMDAWVFDPGNNCTRLDLFRL